MKDRCRHMKIRSAITIFKFRVDCFARTFMHGIGIQGRMFSTSLLLITCHCSVFSTIMII